jgi:hypothetical protein
LKDLIHMTVDSGGTPGAINHPTDSPYFKKIAPARLCGLRSRQNHLKIGQNDAWNPLKAAFGDFRHIV